MLLVRSFDCSVSPSEQEGIDIIIFTSNAVHPNDQTSDASVAGAFSLSRNSGACHLTGPISGLESVKPVGLPRSSTTWERPKSQRTARPSSVMRTLFCLEFSNGFEHYRTEFSHPFEVSMDNWGAMGVQVLQATGDIQDLGNENFATDSYYTKGRGPYQLQPVRLGVLLGEILRSTSVFIPLHHHSRSTSHMVGGSIKFDHVWMLQAMPNIHLSIQPLRMKKKFFCQKDSYRITRE